MSREETSGGGPEPGASAPPQPRVRRAWYVACFSDELGATPIVRELFGQPLVLYRGAEGPAALLDRCPHRNVPLSAGRVVDGQLAFNAETSEAA